MTSSSRRRSTRVWTMGVTAALAATALVAPGPATALPIPALPIPALPQIQLPSNGSLGTVDGGDNGSGNGNVPPVIPETPSTTLPYLVGARTSYTGNVERMLGATGDASLKARLQDLLKTPVAQWVGGDGVPEVTRLVAEGTAKSSVPVIALYHIPDRDLGSHSGGGAPNAAAYKQWIDQVSGAIGPGKAVIILEPDALPQTPDLSAAEQSERIDLLAYALTKLASNTGVTTYLDAGTAGWRSATATSNLMKQIANKGASITHVSANVSNFKSTAATETYIRDIATAFGKPLKGMVDTSRNGGNVTNGEWCNPAAQRLGQLSDVIFTPTSDMEQVFVKTPGESDGVCGVSQKTAGTFDDALLLLQLGIAEAQARTAPNPRRNAAAPR
ncbi:glycoside hydrolase family 6 protein [Gordonia sp. (in: high G+C Gram-positive bacteria)]|uniref:glycoside hydrolase family 6 protein n=1 Tax=Gordonia sp. (in: high G+C Gram-positive bacteria) TaxID=84139 RepID=UPI003C78E6FE